jgi:DNA processing protein
MTDLRYWLLLQNVEGIGTVTFSRLLERFGDPEQVFSADPNEFQDIPRLSDTTVSNIFAAVDRLAGIEQIVTELENAGIKIITIRDSDYPAMLRAIDHPPPLLYVRGVTEVERPVAIIGTREASVEGLNAALNFAQELTRAGFTVVSGYAPGIDTAAHTGAITAGGKTVIVLPTGILRFSSRPELSDIWDDLVVRGTIISEFFPLADWTVGQAMARNRLTSGLSRAVVIIEIGEQGGTMNTAEHADKQGKPIFYYQPLAPTGDSRLRAVRALPVTTPAEVIDRLKL